VSSIAAITSHVMRATGRMDMRFWKRKDRSEPIQTEAARILERMSHVTPGSEEYQVLLGNLERLTKLTEESRPERVNPNTIALIAGNIFGILTIVAYEQKHVVKSKGFDSLIKPKYL
jgi:hypothetical protein